MSNPTPSCCGHSSNDHDHGNAKIDWLLCGSLLLVTLGYIGYYLIPQDIPYIYHFCHGVHEFLHTMWWGVLMGIIFLGLLSKIPRDFIMALLGTNKGIGGILRATGAGVLLDLCSHGILMVGTKLYERGATIGQMMAFLIASPWNSFSMTFILFALIGVQWTLLFIVLSLVIAIISGLFFDFLVKKDVLPANPHTNNVPGDFKIIPEAKKSLATVNWTPGLFKDMALDGLKESRMVMRWLFFGIVLAAGLRMFLDADDFSQYFGPTVLGLTATVTFATILEVCSEGSAPIAADLFNRGGALGNAFAFLMAGVSTDYTEVMVLKDATKSWKVALFLPLITLPQIILIALMLNNF